MKEYWNKQNLEIIVNESKTRAEVLLKIGLRPKGSNFKTLNKYLILHNINIAHFEKYWHAIADYSKKRSRPLSELLNKNINIQSSKLKEKLYKAELKQPICELCGQNELWHGKKISLILDHINGDPYDNRLENLRIVCPNCEGTLDTHCGKNKNKKNKPFEIKKNELHKLKQKEYIPLIEQSNIDFNKFGWVQHVAKIINQKPQKVNKWMKAYMQDFYEQNCFKRN